VAKIPLLDRRPKLPQLRMVEEQAAAASDQDPDSAGNDLVPYRVLDTSNRRVAAVVYLVGAVVAAGLVLQSELSLLWLTGVLPLLGIATYQFMAGRHMQIVDLEAIRIASDEAPFEVGHGSATLGFTGLSARPVWQVLVFESGPVPEHQALVTVNALTGEVTGTYAEAVEPA